MHIMCAFLTLPILMAAITLFCHNDHSNQNPSEKKHNGQTKADCFSTSGHTEFTDLAEKLKQIIFSS